MADQFGFNMNDIGKILNNMRYSVHRPEVNPMSLSEALTGSRTQGYPQPLPSHDQDIFKYMYDGGFISTPDKDTEPLVDPQQRLMGLIADLSPPGAVKGGIEAFTGKDLMTGESIPNWVKPLALAGLLPLSKIPKHVGNGADEIVRIAKKLLEETPNAKPSLLKRILPNRFANRNDIDLGSLLAGRLPETKLPDYNIEMGFWDSDMQNPLRKKQDVAFLNLDPESIPEDELSLLRELNFETHQHKFENLNNGRLINPELIDDSDSVNEVADRLEQFIRSDQTVNILKDDIKSGKFRFIPKNVFEDYFSGISADPNNLSDQDITHMIQSHLDTGLDDWFDSGTNPHHDLVTLAQRLTDDMEGDRNWGHELGFYTNPFNNDEEYMNALMKAPTSTNIGWARMNDMGDDIFINEIQSDLAHYSPEKYMDISPDFNTVSGIDLRKTSSVVGQKAKNFDRLLLENILGFARENEFKNIYLNSPEGVLAQGGGPGPGAMRDLYEKLPKYFEMQKVTGHPLTHTFEGLTNSLSSRARVLSYEYPEMQKALDEFYKGRPGNEVMVDYFNPNTQPEIFEAIGGASDLEQLINKLYRHKYPEGLPLWELNLSDTLK